MRTTTRRTRTAARTAAPVAVPHDGARQDRGLHRRLTVAGLAGLGVPLMAASALATGTPVLGATVTTGTTGVVAEAALSPLRSTAGSVRLCPGDVTSLGVRASAGSLTVVRPRVATAGWAAGTAGAASVSTPGLSSTVEQALSTGAAASASSAGADVDVEAPVVSHVVGATRVVLPALSLQAAVQSVRADVRTAAGFVPAVTAAVDAKARGAALHADGPLALALDARAGGCVDLDWQLLG